MTGAAHKEPVTLALFTYNQEDHVRAAAQSALAQSYRPLHIILSDDCSTDGTYQILQSLAAEYTGPHKVTVRQSPQNRGLLDHINDVAAMVDAGIIVMAAGDDISLAQRTEVLMQVFDHDPQINVVLSDHAVLGAGEPAPLTGPFVVEEISLNEIVSEAGGVGIGATFAYRKACFDWPGKLNKALISEDRILPLRGSIMGRTCKVHAPLVLYRKSEGGLVSKLAREKKWAVVYPPHIAEVRHTLRQAADEGKISPGTYKSLSRILGLRHRFAVMDARRGQFGDAPIRLVGRALFHASGVAIARSDPQKFEVAIRPDRETAP